MRASFSEERPGPLRAQRHRPAGPVPGLPEGIRRRPTRRRKHQDGTDLHPRLVGAAGGGLADRGAGRRPLDHFRRRVGDLNSPQIGGRPRGCCSFRNPCVSTALREVTIGFLEHNRPSCGAPQPGGTAGRWRPAGALHPRPSAAAAPAEITRGPPTSRPARPRSGLRSLSAAAGSGRWGSGLVGHGACLCRYMRSVGSFYRGLGRVTPAAGCWDRHQ